jgi:hypothetical protein
MSNQWSYSKLSTYKGCKLKFKYNYIEHWKAEGVKTDITTKGLSIHETLEQIKSDSTIENVTQWLQEKIMEYKVDTDKYPLMEFVERLFYFYQYSVKPFEDLGWKKYQEFELRGDFNGESFLGYTDLLLDGDDKVIIIDYKTAKGIKPLNYAHQLMLYAYIYGTYYKHWSLEEIESNISIYVFFPLGEIKRKYTDPKSEVEALVKNIDYTANGIKELLEADLNDITKANSTDWNTIGTQNALVEFSCSWCDYRGVPKLGDFPGCPKSYDKGYRMTRGTKIHKKVNS